MNTHPLVTIERITPDEYGRLSINYSFAGTPFGNIILAATPKGLCYLGFAEDERALRAIFPQAEYRQRTDAIQQKALSFFSREGSGPGAIKCHIKGTGFQLKVWETLVKIPMGQLTTYGAIAAQTGNPGASRAVGSAVGHNPVAVLIPCHRVVRSSGALGGYHWGLARKAALIEWETLQTTDK
jgi:AraC family transcriptional regulator of adaptative response/methylated-DNA-[protein]-cysteine methyltransferase